MKIVQITKTHILFREFKVTNSMDAEINVAEESLIMTVS